MKVLLNPSIKSVSGKSGGMLFKTYTKRDGSTETRMYLLPKKGIGKYGYTRKAKVTEKEQASRSRFALIAERIKNLSDEERMNYHEQWRAAKYMFNGKKYATLRGYIMARLYAEL
jgi:hypothetical protein